MMNNFHQEFPKAIDDYMKGTNKVNVEKIVNGIYKENIALFKRFDNAMIKSMIKDNLGVDSDVKNMKNYIRADVKATLLSLGKLGKMNEQAPLIAANLKAIPGYKGGYASKAFTGWSLISLALDTESAITKTNEANAKGQHADATKATFGGVGSIGIGYLAGRLLITPFISFAVAAGPVGWVVLAVGAAAVGYLANKGGTWVGEKGAGYVNEWADIENIPQGGSK
jgi:hypothetical protein